MKKGWPVKSIGELCILRPPKAEARSRLKDESYVSFLPMEDMGIDLKYPIPSKERMLREVDGSYTYFADGDVLLAKITPCFQNGKLGIAKDLRNGTGFGSSEFFVLRPNPVLNSEYLYYFLSRSIFREEGVLCMGGSVGHQRVPPDFLLSQQIILPSLPEQQRIVGVLDEAFTGLATAQANAEKNLQNARALFESHLQSVFTQRGKGWVEKPLETVSVILNGYAFKSTDFSPNGLAKCIKITNVGVREFVCEADNYLPASFSKEYDSVSVKTGSIVIALTRTIIAGGLKVAVVPNEYDGALLNQRVAGIQTNDKLLGVAFLFAYLTTQTVTDYVKGRVNTLMQPNLSIMDLRAMPIPVPARFEQEAITNQLDRLRSETQRLESLYQQKQAALAALKKSLLHQAFSGEL